MPNRRGNVKTISKLSILKSKSPCSSTIASGHLDNNVRLWDARTGNGIKELIGLHSGQITSVSVSPGIVFVYCADRLGKTLIQNPDGSKLLTNSRDNTLHTIDLRMYKVVRTFQYVPLYYRLNTFLS